MKLDWVILANHAESANGLTYISGAGIDTMRTTHLPTQFVGGIALRLKVHPTEIESTHKLEIRFVTEDGKDVARLNADIPPINKEPDLPKGWDYHVMFATNVVMQLQSAGEYSIHIFADGQYLSTLPLRVKTV